MHKWFRKAIAVVLAGALFVTCASVEAFAADGSATISAAASAQATSGNGWSLDADGTLTIENDAGMENWINVGNNPDSDDAYSYYVKTVILKNQVRKLLNI